MTPTLTPTLTLSLTPTLTLVLTPSLTLTLTPTLTLALALILEPEPIPNLNQAGSLWISVSLLRPSRYTVGLG